MLTNKLPENCKATVFSLQIKTKNPTSSDLPSINNDQNLFNCSLYSNFLSLSLLHHCCIILVAETRHANKLIQRCVSAAPAANTTHSTVTSVTSKPKSKWRPLPLDTVELEKLASRKLRINAKETMKIAEKLYTRGWGPSGVLLISYPRTETNIFPANLPLAPLVEQQAQSPEWGTFAQRVLDQPGGPNPRQGKNSDQAHPPIHPTKYTNTLQGNEARVYEFIVRHFLACVSQDALGHETVVEIEIAREKFSTSGLMIIARNYLDVYPYERWSTKLLPVYEQGSQFQPSAIEMVDGQTSPPQLLTEADLISLMEKHGIGTDATHAEHIETIKSRMYVGLTADQRFLPGELGMGLVEGYNSMGYEMSKPNLRAELEADLKLVSEGRKDKRSVLQHHIQKYKAVFIESVRKAKKLDEALSPYLGAALELPDAEQLDMEVPLPVRKCPNCGRDMVLKKKREGNRLKFKFRRGSVPPMMPLEFVGCIGGCDETLREVLDLKYLGGGGRGGEGRTSSDVIVCNCGQDALLLTVRKDGLNQGRQFYKCNSGACNFFLWADQPNQQGAPPQSRGPPLSAHRSPQAPRASLGFGNTSGGGRGHTVCNCNDNAVTRTVQKDGPNKGRMFHTCGKPRDQQCGFFQWADENVPPPGKAHTRAPAARKPRTCGICHMPGHTRVTCPQR
uniref:DNA topoisomerase n=1 Tax=Xiphophorus couchianus TaxID=32473 RepID=A0A3B5MK04_9TELE